MFSRTKQYFKNLFHKHNVFYIIKVILYDFFFLLQVSSQLDCTRKFNVIRNTRKLTKNEKVRHRENDYSSIMTRGTKRNKARKLNNNLSSRRENKAVGWRKMTRRSISRWIKHACVGERKKKGGGETIIISETLDRVIFFHHIFFPWEYRTRRKIKRSIVSIRS